MALFEVTGWDMKSKKVQMGGLNKKKKEKKEKRPKLPKETELKVSEDFPSEKRKRSIGEGETGHEHKRSHNAQTTGDTSQCNSGPRTDDVRVPVPEMPSNLTPLQQKMMAKLSGSRFRWINEQLYTTSSENALKLVKNQPALFDEYHRGFRSQVQLWPENPVSVFVDQFKARTSRPVNAPGGLPGLANKQIVIADMGCGEAQFALDINNFVKEYNGKKSRRTDKKKTGQQTGPKTLDVEVHSFDLKKANERITVADIKNVPMKDESCNIAIFCLALMGTNFLDFIEEAYRILAPNGELWIAEIKSRFGAPAKARAMPQGSNPVGEEFVDSLKLLGFYHKRTDNENKIFTRFEFFKPSREIVNQKKKLQKRQKFVEEETQKDELKSKRSKVPEGEWLLKPCIYKRR